MKPGSVGAVGSSGVPSVCPQLTQKSPSGPAGAVAVAVVTDRSTAGPPASRPASSFTASWRSSSPLSDHALSLTGPVCPPEVAVAAENPTVPLAFGGVFATLNAQLVKRQCPEVDFVCRGDGEQ